MKTILILRHRIQNQDFGEAQSDWLVLAGRREDQVFRIPTCRMCSAHREAGQGSGALCSARHRSSIHWVQGKSMGLARGRVVGAPG